jgi:hypothetical protein
MMRNEWLLAAVAAAAGFLGGTISSGMATVFAQERTQQITAERFVVADANGIKRGELGLDAQDRINLTLYNAQGRVLWSAPVRRGIFPAGPDAVVPGSTAAWPGLRFQLLQSH